MPFTKEPVEKCVGPGPGEKDELQILNHIIRNLSEILKREKNVMRQIRSKSPLPLKKTNNQVCLPRYKSTTPAQPNFFSSPSHTLPHPLLSQTSFRAPAIKIDFIRSFFSPPDPAIMSAAKTKAQGIIDDNAVGEYSVFGAVFFCFSK